VSQKIGKQHARLGFSADLPPVEDEADAHFL